MLGVAKPEAGRSACQSIYARRGKTGGGQIGLPKYFARLLIKGADLFVGRSGDKN